MFEKIINYFLAIIIALDQLVNALIGGDPDEMISSRAHREALKGSKCWINAEKLIDKLFFWQIRHCRMAADYEDSIVIKKYKRIRSC